MAQIDELSALEELTIISHNGKLPRCIEMGHFKLLSSHSGYILLLITNYWLTMVNFKRKVELYYDKRPIILKLTHPTVCGVKYRICTSL